MRLGEEGKGKLPSYLASKKACLIVGSRVYYLTIFVELHDVQHRWLNYPEDRLPEKNQSQGYPLMGGSCKIVSQISRRGRSVNAMRVLLRIFCNLPFVALKQAIAGGLTLLKREAGVLEFPTVIRAQANGRSCWRSQSFSYTLFAAKNSL